MAMRMMLLRNVLGASTYQYHTEQTIKTLKAVANGKTPFQIKDPDKLITFEKRFDIPSDLLPEDEIALLLCSYV